jgi:hypothetical protein
MIIGRFFPWEKWPKREAKYLDPSEKYYHLFHWLIFWIILVNFDSLQSYSFNILVETDVDT